VTYMVLFGSWVRKGWLFGSCQVLEVRMGSIGKGCRNGEKERDLIPQMGKGVKEREQDKASCMGGPCCTLKKGG